MRTDMIQNVDAKITNEINPKIISLSSVFRATAVTTTLINPNGTRTFHPRLIS